jgi:hypothetical protein
MKKFFLTLLMAAFLLSIFSTTVLAQENLLSDPSFEQNDESWTSSAWEQDENLTKFEFVAQGAKDGSMCAYIKSSRSNDARWEQSITVQPNTTYRLSGYIKAAGCGQDTTGANLSFLNTFVASKDFTDTSGEWEYVEVYAKTGEDQSEATIAARLGSYGSTNIGEARFDNITLEDAERELKVEVFPVKTDGAELIKAILTN